MNKHLFRRVLEDLTRRVEKEGKKNPSWLMGYLQGLGFAKLNGYQCAALVDLLLVPLEKEQFVEEALESAAAHPEEKTDSAISGSLLETLAQR